MSAEVHTLIGAYVLDAVDDLERAAFDRHLRECESCRLEVDELREASARLADGAWSVPPPALRDNVMAAIGKTRQLGPPAPVPVPVPVSPSSSSSSSPSRRPMSRRRLLTAAAAVVVAAAGAASTTYAIQEQRVRKGQSDAEAVNTLLASPDLVVKEEPVTGGGRVTVASSRRTNAGLIILAADAAPTGDRVFQLWTIRDQKPTSQGALAVGQSSIVKFVDGLPQFSAVGVTIEKAPSSPTPTTMVGQVTLT